MAKAETLLDTLRRAGRVDSEGDFTLDGRKAQEKMREFALVDSHEYVLKIVQAAVAGGASRVDVSADARGVRVVAHGWQVSAEVLADPFAGLFISQERVEAQDWRHLAIGLNAALALQPQGIEVRAGGRVLRIESAESRSVRDEASTHDGTRIDVLERVSWRLAGRALKALVGGVPEAQLVATRVSWCRVHVTLNGRGVTDPEWTATIRRRVGGDPHYAGDDFVTWLPAGVSADTARVTFIKHGVQVCERALELPPLQAFAAMHGDDLLTNASGSDVVDDGRYKACVDDLRKRGEDLLLRLAAQSDVTEDSPWWTGVRPHLLRVVAARFGKSLRGDGSAVCEALLKTPLFRDIQGNPVTLADIAAARTSGGSVQPCRGMLTLAKRPLHLYVQVDGTDAFHALGAALGAKWLEPLADRERTDKMTAWLTRQARPLELPSRGPFIETMPFEENDIRGSIALPRHLHVSATAFIRFMVDGRDAVTKFVDLGGPRFEAVVDCPRLSLNDRFDDLVDDAAYDQVKAVLLARYERLCAQAAKRVEGDEPRTREVHSHLLDLLLTRAPDAPLDAAIEAVPLFPTVAGKNVAIAELRRDVAEFSATYVISAPSPGPQLDHRNIVVDVEKKALRKVLTRVFGAKKVVDYSHRLDVEREALRKMQGPVEALVLPDALLATEFAVGDIRGVVGIMRPGSTARPVSANAGPRNMTRRPAVIGLLKEGRRIVTRDTVLKVGPLEALVDSPRFTPNASWDAVRNDDGMKEAMDALEQGMGALVVRAAEALPTLNAWGRALALQVLVDYVAWKPDALPAQVAQAPIFPTIDGRVLSVSEVRQEVARMGDLYCVFAQPAATDDETGRPVLRLDTDERVRAVRAAFSGVRLVDRKRDLAVHSGRKAFLRRAQQPASLTVDASRFIIRVPLSNDGVQGWSGEIGLLGPEQPSAHGVRVTVLREGREIDQIVVQAPLASEAVVGWDTAPVSETWSALASEAAVKEVRGVVGKAVEAAVAALLDRDVRRGTPEAMLLLAYAMRRARSASDLLRGPDLLKRVSAAPIVEDSTGAPLSLATLASEYQTFKRLPWVGPGVEGQLVEKRHVLRCDPHTLKLFELVFSNTHDAEFALDLARMGRRNYEKAPRVTTLRVGEGPWLARVAASGGGLQGELAVSPTAGARVDMVVDGRLVERRQLFAGISLAGVITGPSLKANDSWDEVELKLQHERALDKMLDALFEQVARKAVGDASARAALLAYYLARRNVFKEMEGGLPAAARVEVFPLVGGGHVSLQSVMDVWRLEPVKLPAGWTRWLQDRVTEVSVTKWNPSEKQGLVYVAREPVEWPYPLLSSRDRPIVAFLEDFFDVRAVCHVDGRSAAAVAEEWAREAARERQNREAAQQWAANRRESEAREQQRRADERARQEAQRQARERAREAEVLLRQREAEALRLTPDEADLQQALTEAFARLCARLDEKWRECFARVTVSHVYHSNLVTVSEKGHPVIAADHSVTRLALTRFKTDRGALACLVSAVYTTVNQWEAGVTDDDEVRFMEDLADWLLEEA